MPTFATPEPIAVRIDAIEGSLRLVATDRADTTVQVLPRDFSREADVWAAEHTRVDFHDGKLVVSGARRGLAFFRECATDVEIALPAGSRLQASLGSADLRAAGEFGDLRIATASGDVQIDSVTGNIKVTNSSGALSVQAIDGSAWIATASGEVSVGELDGHLKFKAAGGSLTLGRLSGRVKAHTASGSVEVGAAVRGGVSAHTSSGDVTVGVAEGTAARLDIATASGMVSNDLQPSDGPHQGDETLVVQVRSGSGDVSVRRATPARQPVPAT